MTRGVRHADIYIDAARMVKFLRPDKDLEGAVLDLGHTLDGRAFA